MRSWLGPALRLTFTVGALAVLAWQLDTGDVLARLGALSPGWTLLGVLISVPQVVVSAWRWRLTARQIGIALPWRMAIREYYLATFLNQILPGGVMGDAARAWRHSQQSSPESGSAARGSAVRAVIIERASGQLALVIVAGLTLLASPMLRDAIGSVALPAVSASVAALSLVGALSLLGVVVALAVAATVYRRRIAPSSTGVVGPFIRDLRLAFEGRVGPLQLVGSLIVVATYLAVFLCAARALGIDRPLLDIAPLVPPLLMAMAIPLSVAGWGLREGAAALLWPLAGFPAQEGVTLSITYGLLILAGSLPGLAVLAVGHLKVRRPGTERSRGAGTEKPENRRTSSFDAAPATAVSEGQAS